MNLSWAAPAACLLAAVPILAQDVAEPVVLVVDYSAAMNHPMGGVRRGEAVRSALQELVREFPGNVSLGWIAFGHRTKDNCGDVEVIEHVQAPQAARVDRLLKRLGSTAPAGKCAVSRALLETIRVLQRKPGHVVLIAAGEDNCGADPCGVAATLQQSGVPVRVDVIAVGTQAPLLACVSRILNGSFITVQDAAALRRAVINTTLGRMPGGRLRVTVSQTSKSAHAPPYVTVYQSGRPLAQLPDNPSVFQLPSGSYEVSARLGPHSESARVPVSVRNGTVTDQALSIATGVLVVNLTRGQGKPLTPMPTVELIRGEAYVAGARSLPARFEAGAGTYGLRVTLTSRQQYVVQGLTIEPGRTVERAVEVPAGQVQVFVSGRRYQGPIRPFVEIVQNDRFIASFAGSPAAFQLLPGSYTARVRDRGYSVGARTLQVTAGADLRVEINVR